MQKNEFENIPVFYTPLQVTNVELGSGPINFLARMVTD